MGVFLFLRLLCVLVRWVCLERVCFVWVCYLRASSLCVCWLHVFFGVLLFSVGCDPPRCFYLFVLWVRVLYGCGVCGYVFSCCILCVCNLRKSLWVCVDWCVCFLWV